VIRNKIRRAGHRQLVLYCDAFAQRRDTHACVGIDGQRARTSAVHPCIYAGL
jgi:hypothetical protein